jgi:hypothetical protein
LFQRASRGGEDRARQSRSWSSCRSSPRRGQPPGGARGEGVDGGGSSFQTSLPGNVVPPPRPAARESRPTSRAAEASSASRAPMRARVVEGVALPDLQNIENALD